MKDDIPLTPVEFYDRYGIWVKREDLFKCFDVNGSKARVALYLIQKSIANGEEVVTAGGRDSYQCEIISDICQHMGVVCHIFMPDGQETESIKRCTRNSLTQMHMERPGYNNVVISRAKRFSENHKCMYIPFGMECAEAIAINKNQVANIPHGVKRIVIPVGGGMSLCAVARGIKDLDIRIPILGVVTGMDPQKTIAKYIGDNDKPDVELVQAKTEYRHMVKANIDGIELDPIYEAKCIDYIKDGDLLWIVGSRWI